MTFHLDSPWGATLMTLTACAMDWRRNRILRVGRNSGAMQQFYDVCGPKFMKFWDNVGDPLSFPTPCPVIYLTFRSEDIGQ